MQTLSCSMHAGSISPTRDRTRAPCIGSAESYPLNHQGSPRQLTLSTDKLLLEKIKDLFFLKNVKEIYAPQKNTYRRKERRRRERERERERKRERGRLLRIRKWSLTQMNLSTKQKQTDRHREQSCGCQGGGGWGRDGLGVWD